MIKVFIAPQFTNPDNGDGGIRRVVEAQLKYLPDFDIEVVTDIGKADLTVGHGTIKPRRKGVPFISICHGMHWADYKWGLWAHDVNGMVRDALLQADAITVPSIWVHRAITRSLLRNPTIIYHGIDPKEWEHNKRTQGYTLWNKARKDQVSNPKDMQLVAKLLPEIEFRSTVGEDTPNVKIFGVKPADLMKPIIQRASVYLATARETFGIGTLEALASGVPVAGWNYGGQSEIIKHGETGYLAPVGDYDRLAECIRSCYADRDRLSANAVTDIHSRWLWPDKIQQYAELFKRVALGESQQKPVVSVIVTCHNLGRYLPQALDSVIQQTLTDWECIIVDDQSTDLTAEIATDYAAKDKRFIYHKTQKNLGLCGALNYGFDKSSGKYIVNLDADNMLTPDALRIQVEALDNDASIHIVCGDLDVVDENGNERREKIWHVKSGFDWRGQLAHINQIHSSSMMRREVRQQTGGYRERYWRAEDAHFWTLATSYGFRAKIVTDYPTMIYRFRGDSKSAHEYNLYPDKDGDWTADFPYRLASNAQDGYRMLKETQGIPNAQAVPFAAQGVPTINSGLCWNVYHHEAPFVSIIIPVGKGHEGLVIDALDSLQSQDFINWEAIVVNDTGGIILNIAGHPYARIITNNGERSPAIARNLGIKAAKGKLIYFLDADDMLVPGATLRKLIAAYVENDQSYIYSDYIKRQADPTQATLVQMDEYRSVTGKPLAAVHSVNILIAKQDLESVGLFDETLGGWEDWDLFCKLSIAGYCGKRLPIPAFIYRFDKGQRREADDRNRSDLLPKLRSRYNDYDTGIKDMAKCCNGNGDLVLLARQELALNQQWMGDSTALYQTSATQKFEQTSGIQDKPVRMEFTGDRKGGVTYFGKDGRQYTGGNNPSDKYIDAHPSDVEKLEMTGVWRVIQVEPQKIEEPIIQSMLDLPEFAIQISETISNEFPQPEHLAIAVIEMSVKAKRTRKKKVKADV